MAGQWPNQPPAQEGFSYPSYPEQYPQQQYPEQYSQQQYGPGPQQYQYGPPQNAYQQYGQQQPGPYQQHSGPYQQPYQQQTDQQQSYPQQAYPQPPSQQQPVQTYKQNIAMPSPQTCYNCGSPEHWAQNCSEPRRQIPAGDLARQSTQRPVKKFRPDYVPPVITKYPVPPHVQAMHGTGPGYVGQPYPQQLPQAYQAPYGQPTPLSAQPYGHPHFQQWPENQQQQPHPASFQRRNTYPQQPNSGYGPTPYYPPGPQYASPVSAHGPHQYPGFNPPYNTGEPHQGPQLVPYTSASPGVPQSPFEIAQAQAGFDNGEMRQNSISQSRSMTQSATPSVQQAIPPPEDTIGGEDIALLDIPDLPTNKGGDGIRLVQKPLPALAKDLEAIGGSLPFPSPSSKGFVKSQYVDKDTYESQIWDLDCEQAKLDLEDDPIFCFVKNDIAISVDVLRDSHGRKTIGELYSETTHSERDLNASRFESEPSNDRVSDHTLPKDTENRLAALGVTGFAKPVHAPARPYPPPKAQSPPSSTSPPRQENGRHYSRYSGRVSSPGSRSPRRYDSARYGYRERSASPPYARDRDHTPPYQRDRSPHNYRARTPPAYDDTGATWSTTRQRDPFDPRDNDLDGMGYVQKTSPTNVKYDQYNPPPPPQSPPPPRRSKSSNYGLSRNEPQYPQDIYSPEHVDGHHQAGSPTKHTPEKSNHRKRNREYRDDSDDEGDKERRRQYDDVTPKLKRRQPDVPEAYG
ncbi:hypothetical protein MMC30_007080 [Trapelia coarctata]|nr:hypothetical protein [Trapelia coarctata]